MDKKGKMGILPIIAIMVIAGMVVTGGVIAVMKFGIQKQTAVEKAATEAATEGKETALTATCPDTKRHGYVRILDNGAAITTQIAGQVYVYDKEGVFIGNYSTATSGYTDLGQLCGEYKVVAMTNAGASGSGETMISVGFDDARKDISANQLTNLQATVSFMDMPEGSRAAYLGVNGAFASNSTSYSNVNETLVATDASNTAKAIAADGKIDVLITAKSAAARKSFGDKSQKTFVCLDIGTGSVWDVANALSVQINGVSKNNIKSLLKGTDQTGSLVQNAEACFDAGTAFENQADNTIRITLNTRASQNPGTSDDLVLSFLPEGVYSSSATATPSQALAGIYTDAASQVLVGTSSAYTPTLQIQVS